MRRVLCALMMTLILLTGCGRGGEEAGYSAEEVALRIRAEYLAMTACNASVDVTADYGQRVYEYSMDLAWKKNGETRLTITAPENIAGITARIQDGKSFLEYDTVSLETGALSGTGLSPIEVVPAALNYILSGYIGECDFETVDERVLLWFCCRDPEAEPGVGTEAAFWFDPDSHALTRVEVMSNGYCVVRCVFREFTIESTKIEGTKNGPSDQANLGGD